MSDAKQGPLEFAELESMWLAAVDDSYSAPIVAAGEGGGYEVVTQAYAQLARVSEAVDRTTQALYILPHSAQTGDPAGGDAQATVTLTFTRGAIVPLGAAPRDPAVPTQNYIDRALHIPAGTTWVEEQQAFSSPDGPVSVLTGRRYLVVDDVVFMPGEVGPIAARAVAENPGWGYNNPMPGTLVSIQQPGSSLYHDRGAVHVTASAVAPAQPPPNMTVTLATVNEADTFIPDNVGQHVLFTAGLNAGHLAPIVGYAAPDGVANKGATVTLEPLCVVELSTVTGAFAAGEFVQVKLGGTVVGWGRFLVARASSTPGRSRVAFVLLSGTIASMTDLVGATSGADASGNVVVLADPAFVEEALPPNATIGQGANWRVLDWNADLGVQVTNAAAPVGGRLGLLDEIGRERNRPRATGEGDDAYRARVAEIADTVSPNAINRALSRVMGVYSWCFREVGLALLPGFYLDRTDADGDYWDSDTVTVAYGGISGAFVDPAAAAGYQERVELRDAAGNVKSRGYLSTTPGGGNVTFVRRGYGSEGTLANPYAFASGDVLVGLSSGAVATLTGAVATPSVAAHRFRVLLDTLDMRGMFMVGVPRVAIGEFGFAWSNTPASGLPSDPNAMLDGPATANDFLDGYPAESGAFYRRAWQAVEAVRAGGVGWYLYREDGSCA